MSPVTVKRLLGEPDAKSATITGKVFIPFYFGDDETWHYKGLARVKFSGGILWSAAVYEVEQDPHEPGYFRR